MKPKGNQLKLYYVLQLLIIISGIFTHTIYYIYLTSKLGFTNSQAMFLDTVLFIGIFFFEVPTGILADKYGRKFSFIIARIVLGFSFLTYFLSGNYFVLLIGSILFAIGMAFESGSFEAWIVDQISKEDRHNIYIGNDILRKISIITIPLLSVFLAEKFSYNFPYLISSILSFTIVIIGFLFMKENKEIIQRNITEKKGLESLLEIGKFSIREVFNNQKLKLFFMSVLLTSFGYISINSYSSKLIELTINSASVGIIISISSLFSILFTIILNKIKILEKIYLFIGIIGSISLIFIGITNIPFVIILLFNIQVISLTSFEIQRQNQINKQIEKNRATVLSIFSFAGAISGIIGTIIFGYLADIYSINFTFSIAGIAISLAILILNRGNRASLNHFRN